MTSSVDTRRQPIDDDGEPSISAERLDSTSVPGSLVGLESNHRNETPVLSDAQRQSTSEIEVESTDEEGQDELPREERERREEEEREREALRQIMEGLKDTTGFGSYEAYLESYRRDPMYAGRCYNDILARCFREPRFHGRGVDVIDVSSKGLTPVEVSVRWENLSASGVSWALCHPPPNTRAQIVLWPMDANNRVIEEYLNVLGVGLLLDPCFFEALRWREDETELSPYFRSKNVLCMGTIGTSVFLAPRFVLAQDDPVPVVLIAGPLLQPVEPKNYDASRSVPLTNKALYDLVQAAPLYSHYHSRGHSSSDDRPRFANTYIRVLSALLESDRSSVRSPCDTLSACIIPLLQIEIAVCKADLEHLRNLFSEFKDAFLGKRWFETEYRTGLKWNKDRLLDGETPEYLYSYRTRLRSWIEYFGNENGAWMDLLSSLPEANVTKGEFYPQIKEERSPIAEEASRLEAEIRDYLQLEGSRLALLESKRSIELSNYQIYEARRVKIFTILAFFYVPLNLATSIYGMDLQQLNSNGRSIWIFLGTAAILLVATGVTWFSIEGVQDARGWVSEVREDRSILASEYPSMFTRLYLIWWLSRNGLFMWMIYTGGGLCLLTNSSRRFQSQSGLCNGAIENLSAIEAVFAIMPRLTELRDSLNRTGGWLPKLSMRRADTTPPPFTIVQ